MKRRLSGSGRAVRCDRAPAQLAFGLVAFEFDDPPARLFLVRRCPACRCCELTAEGECSGACAGNRDHIAGSCAPGKRP
jgi:hypothetical protein